MPRLAYDAEAQRVSNLKHRFGMTLEEYDELFDAQNGGCAICGGANTTGRRLAVDHDHETGEVRGLLCFGCNIGLGKFKDDVTLVKRAAAYLEGTSAEPV